MEEVCRASHLKDRRKSSWSTKEETTMKRFTRLISPYVAYAFIYLPLPDTADACIEEGTGSAVLKVLAAVLVGGVFVYNHFRNRIHTFVNKLLSSEEKREGAEDQG
jgi:hypothetical protein